MRGELKFVDGKTELWGFIVPEDGGTDIHFEQKNVVGGKLTRSHAGHELEFDVVEDRSGRHAKNIRLIAVESDMTDHEAVTPIPAPIPMPRSAPSGAFFSDELTQWAFIIFRDTTSRDGKTFRSVLPNLVEKALDEHWYFGKKPDPRHPYPILENYLKFTFFRLRRENKIVESTVLIPSGQTRKWAAFNTGLVDKLYDPIFALFDENQNNTQPWRFYAFCVPGKGPEGK
jgi:cold shock CspA family protein